MNTATWSKKLVFAVIVVVCATWLAAAGKLAVDQWQGLVETIGMTYIIAQGAIDAVVKRSA